MSFQFGQATPTTAPDVLARAFRKKGKPVVLVPVLSDTLHAGHFALIRAARSIPGAVTIVAAPFRPKGLADAGVDAVWVYDFAELWPYGLRVGLNYQGLDAAVPDKLARVLTLTNKVGASDLVMGEKDYELLIATQQVFNDFAVPTRIHQVPTVRLANGLAVAGKNARIPEEHREAALVVSAALTAGAFAASGGAQAVLDAARAVLEAAEVEPDYLELRSVGLREAPSDGDARLLVGVTLGGVHLADSVGFILGEPEG